MCRNIKMLFNFDPPASQEEIRAAATQYVRKVSGFQKPSVANQAAFQEAIERVSRATSGLLDSLSTPASPRDRETELARAHARAVRRFGPARTSE